MPPFSKKRTSKKKTGITITLGIGIFIFLIAFRKEFINILLLLWSVIRIVLGRQGESIPPDTMNSISILFFNCIFGFGATFFIWLLLIANQALLPITPFGDNLSQAMRETYRAAWHLMLHIMKRHGPAIFIQNGKEISSPQEKFLDEQGVIVIDFNSAAVFEQRIPPPGVGHMLAGATQKFLELLGLSDPQDMEMGSQRVYGPGVVFTRIGERLRGVIDLRKQSRFQGDIRAYTRDGIELASGVWTLFTVGQKPEVLDVAYQGERQAGTLRAISIRKINEHKVQITTLPADEIDSQDRQEIHEKTDWDLFHYEELPPIPFAPEFDAQRIFAALSSKARNPQNELAAWDDLPPRVATDIFREVIADVLYDSIYTTDKDNSFMLPEIKRRFKIAVRNTGLLSYRMVFHRKGDTLTDGEYSIADLLVSPVYPLTSKKVLRERGIKVIASGFLDLKPISNAVYQKRLDAWHAKWEADVKIKSADHQHFAQQNRKEGLQTAIKELADKFPQINIDFDNPDYHSQEALTIRIFQALQSIAADPKSNQFLPADTVRLMTELREWLLPDSDQQSISGYE